MAKFRWHTLDKKPRDPGWAEERPEPTGVVTAPRSPFPSRRKERLTAGTGWVSGSATGRLNKLKTKGKGKSKKTSKGTAKTGATTPFDYYSLSTASDIARERAARKTKKSIKRARKLERRKVTATGTQPAAKSKAPVKRRTVAAATPVPTSSKQPPVVEVLPASMGKTTNEAVTLTWRSHPDVVRWKVSCIDDAGVVVRKAGLASEVLTVTLGGLDQTTGLLTLRVKGHNALGQLVCEGVLSEIALKRR